MCEDSKETITIIKMESTITNEELIAAVEKRKHLYDRSDDQYSNRVFINRQWQEIEDELGINDQSARKRWTALRDYFVKTHKLINKSGSATDKKKKWYLYDAMLFLLPYLAVGKSKNFSNNISDESVQGSEEGYLPTSTERSCLEPSSSASIVYEIPQRASTALTASPSSKKRKTEFPNEISSQRMCFDEATLEAIKKIKTIDHNQDEDELFLLSLAPKLRLLDPLLKTECQAEMQMLLLRFMHRALKSHTPLTNYE